jgi:phospholipid transport system substrate-binding protein
MSVLTGQVPSDALVVGRPRSAGCWHRLPTILLTGLLLGAGVPSIVLAQAAQSSSAQGQSARQSPSSSSSPAGQTGNESPSDVVQTAAQNMLRALDADRAGYRKDPSKIGQLVDKYLLPHFDVDFAARLVLGPHWRQASEEQRKRFVQAFYHSLLANYGSALAEFTADKLKVYPTNVDPNSDHATVRTEVKRSNGDRVAVNYYMRQTPQGWKAWDVVIDGISYVKSYREDFGAQIDQQGMDAVINRLEKGEKPSDVAKTTGKAS